MDAAIDAATGEFIDAEDLRDAQPGHETRYECPSGEMRVFPASYRPRNVVTSYFSARGTPHRPDCDVDDMAHRVEIGRREPLSKRPGGFPLPVPDRLELRDERLVIAAPNEPREGRSGRVFASRAPKDRARLRSYAVHTIRPLCRTFIRFPWDRDDLRLRVDGVSGGTYREAHVFHARLRWTAPTKSTNEALEVTLNDGRSVDGVLVPHRLVALWHVDGRDIPYARFQVERLEFDVSAPF